MFKHLPKQDQMPSDGYACLGVAGGWTSGGLFVAMEPDTTQCNTAATYALNPALLV